MLAASFDSNLLFAVLVRWLLPVIPWLCSYMLDVECPFVWRILYASSLLISRLYVSAYRLLSFVDLYEYLYIRNVCVVQGPRDVV